MSSIIPSYFKDMSDGLAAHETQGQDYQEILSSPDTTDTTDLPPGEAEKKSEDLPETKETDKSMKTKKTEKSVESDRPEKKKRSPRPRKDVLCEVCGKTYSSLTKSHKRCPAKGFVKADKAETAEEAESPL